MTYHLLDTSRYYISSRFSRKSNCEPSRGKIEQFPLSIMDIVLGLIVSTIFMAGLSFNSNKHVRPQPRPSTWSSVSVGIPTTCNITIQLAIPCPCITRICSRIAITIHPSANRVVMQFTWYLRYLASHSLTLHPVCEWLAKPLLTSPHFTSITGTSHRLLLLLTTVSADPPPCPVISSCCRSPVQNSSPSSAHPTSSSS